IYNYFPTKEHIPLFFFEQALERVQQRFPEERQDGMAFEEEVFLLITLQLEEVEPYQDFLHLMVAQAASPSSRLNLLSLEVQRLKRRYLDFVTDLASAAQDRDELPRLGFDSLLLNGFWAFQLGLLLFWLNDESAKKEDTFVLLDRSLRFTLDALRRGTAEGAEAVARLAGAGMPADPTQDPVDG
ncbi:MAG: hypothetical protein AAF657_31595, partial [Acidobacteriota bacterium]